MNIPLRSTRFLRRIVLLTVLVFGFSPGLSLHNPPHPFSPFDLEIPISRAAELPARNSDDHSVSSTVVRSDARYRPGAVRARLPSTQTISSQRVIIKTQNELDYPLIPTGSTSLDDIMAQFDVESLGPLFNAHRGNVALKEALGLSRMYVLTLPVSSDVRAALSAFTNLPLIEYAEPDAIGYGAGLPDDEWFDYQWNLHNTGQSGGTPGADVSAPEAWDISTGVTSTVLAVVDTGADLDHLDLVSELVDGYDFANDDATPQDDHGHGTHISGIAAGATNNSIGMAGVCPACRVMPLKALNSDNWGYYTWWADAIEYAVDHGAAAINMSMGGTDNSQVLHDAVRYAYHADVPIVAAMMNDGDDTLYYPAAFTETIAVGATNRNDERWDDPDQGSNYGDHIDLVAPGKAILGTIPDDTYAFWDGTSMATPHVVGTLGLIHSIRSGYTVETLRQILRASADDQVGPPNEDKQGWDPYFGAGRLNAAQAVQRVVPPRAVTITGPSVGLVGTERTFVAAVAPITTAQPITYVWQATGQAPITHTSGLTDAASFTWVTSGTHTVTLTLANFGGSVTGTHSVAIRTLLPGDEVTVCSGDTCDFDTIQDAVDVSDERNIIKVAAGTYTGVNARAKLAQVVYISKTVTIQGGYTTAFTAPPDPESNPTILDAEGNGRGLYITGKPAGERISPTIEGLHVTGGDATGLGGGLGVGDAGGGIYAIASNPTISNSQIVSNTARWGGGIYLQESDATLRASVITSNTARWGGGLYAESGSDARLEANTFVNNSAAKDGGGLYLRESLVSVEENVITANHADESAGGLYLYESASTVRGNVIDANVARWGGGIYLWKSAATLGENQMRANTAEDGGGLYLGNSSPTLVNNVIADNAADLAGGGVYIKGSTPHLLHTTLAGNRDSGIYIHSDATGPGTVALTNTILTDHSVGITVTAGNTVTLEGTLWDNTLDWSGNGAIISGASAHNVWGDPAFVAPDAGDYHIEGVSVAIDAGVDSGIDNDLDGDLRPIGEGYDLGADEFPAALRLSQRVNANPAQAGMPLTYTLRLTNTGEIDLRATVTDRLPAHVSPTGLLTWTPVLTTPAGTWSQTFVVTVATDHTGPLTNVVDVTTREGFATSNAMSVIAAQATTTIEPWEKSVLVLTDSDNLTVTFEIPAGAVTKSTQLAYTPISTVTSQPAGLSFAGRAFELGAYRRGERQDGLAFARPITTVIHYTKEDVVGLDEDTLDLRYLDGGAWVTDGITVTGRDTAHRRLVATVGHLSTFAMFAQEEQDWWEAYLPTVLRLAIYHFEQRFGQENLNLLPFTPREWSEPRNLTPLGRIVPQERRDCPAACHSLCSEHCARHDDGLDKQSDR